MDNEDTATTVYYSRSTGKTKTTYYHVLFFPVASDVSEAEGRKERIEKAGYKLIFSENDSLTYQKIWEI
jgi:hypothetical protein